jgi:hypothetical protein
MLSFWKKGCTFNGPTWSHSSLKAKYTSNEKRLSHYDHCPIRNSSMDIWPLKRKPQHDLKISDNEHPVTKHNILQI